jgi:lysozyme
MLLIAVLFLLDPLSVRSTEYSSNHRFSALDKVVKTLLPLLKEEEGYRSCPYECSAMHTTVGYGHVIKEGDSWMHRCLSEFEANALLQRDIVDSYLTLERIDARYVKKLPTNATAGLVRFQYNIGPRGLQRSTVHKLFKSIFLEHPEYLTCSSVNKLLELGEVELQLERVLCQAGAGTPGICEQFNVLSYRQQLEQAFKQWNKITVKGRLVVLPALTERRLLELQMVMPSCKSAVSKLTL